ncbi:hypothetical protein ACLK17_21100 [Escherichia coli]
MKNVGFIGWRGMVGSVLTNAWLKSALRRHSPCLLSTSQLGQAVPSFGGTTRTLQDAFDPEALKALEIIVTCQAADNTNEMYPSFVKADGKVTGSTQHRLCA